MERRRVEAATSRRREVFTEPEPTISSRDDVLTDYQCGAAGAKEWQDRVDQHIDDKLAVRGEMLAEIAAVPREFGASSLKSLQALRRTVFPWEVRRVAANE
jgi:hypothetical protein